MKIWCEFNTTLRENYKFTAVRYLKRKNDTYGYIYFNNNIGNDGGRIELLTRNVFYKDNRTELQNENKAFTFANEMHITDYTNSVSLENYLFLCEIEIINSGGGGNPSPPSGGDDDNEGDEGGGSEAPEEPIVFQVDHTQILCREKQQVRPTDQSQEWSYTNNERTSKGCDTELEECSCAVLYRWVDTDGFLCDNTNKYHKQKFQRKLDCESEWEDILPDVYRIGSIIEYDSSECGTYEYKEDWDAEEYCGSYLREEFGVSLTDTSKYKIKRMYVKKKEDDVWEEPRCDSSIIGYTETQTDCFECGWYTTKEEQEYDYDLCGTDVLEKYPKVSNTSISKYNKYDITITHIFQTKPYPENTDDMDSSEWLWEEVGQRYTAKSVEIDSCDCGYYYLQWDLEDEYKCGSELGNEYDSTTLYQKKVEYKYCKDTRLEPTDGVQWVRYERQCCECGYRITTTEKEYVYEYTCGNDLGGSYKEGYMYYKVITRTYEQCTDGSNRELVDTKTNYVLEDHSDQNIYECVYNEEYDAYIDQKITNIRTFYNRNTYTYEPCICGGDYVVLDTTINTKSSECGYEEEWVVDGTVCCGNLEFDKKPKLSIISAEGNWLRDGDTFTSNNIGNSDYTDVIITFEVDRICNVVINYDVSSESGFDEFRYTEVDGTNFYYGNHSGTKVGSDVLQNISRGTHKIGLRYIKDSSAYVGRDNVIVTLSVGESESCASNAKYNIEYFRYTVDGGNTWIEDNPRKYRYGNIVEYNSEECGYIPRLEQWVLVCPDITYEEAYDGDECTICATYNNAPTMFAIEKKQYSIDKGATWIDSSPLETRTERILKWKADKCGYTGDIFEFRWTDTYCDGTNLYGTRTTYVSSDNGETWTMIEGTTVVTLKEANSTECIEEGTE